MGRITYNKPSEGSFTIPGVKLPHRDKNGIYTFEIMENLSEPMNYNQIQEHNIKKYEAGNPIIGSAKDLLSAFHRALQLKDKDFNNFVYNEFRKRNWFNVATGFIWNPEGKKDMVVDYEGLKGIKGQEDLEQIFEGNYVGPNSWLNYLNNEKIFRDFTGQTKNQLEKISQVMNKTSGFLWRFNSNPNTSEKRQARLVGDSVRLDFDANRGLFNYNPGFRVLVKKQN